MFDVTKVEGFLRKRNHLIVILVLILLLTGLITASITIRIGNESVIISNNVSNSTGVTVNNCPNDATGLEGQVKQVKLPNLNNPLIDISDINDKS